ncbi:MAG: hypothetical protein GOMPHAMPRED_006852 [Gomphillus americanus]|uniref:Uncharacterized protein n=1 Tax=Gomphillus americanus TaxID=1940652 RepID=A0A8H3EQT7_9LECA|nr:MAG: hypothetical protein GOMPHAMPRED_006852 [Gomphillus americanus]
MCRCTANRNGLPCNLDGAISFEHFRDTLAGHRGRDNDIEQVVWDEIVFAQLFPSPETTRQEWYQMAGLGQIGFYRGDWARLPRAVQILSSERYGTVATAPQGENVVQAEIAGPSGFRNAQDNVESESEIDAVPAPLSSTIRLPEASGDYSSGYEGDDEKPTIRRTPVNAPGTHHAHLSVLARTNNNSEELDDNEAESTSQGASNFISGSNNNSAIDSTGVQVPSEQEDEDLEMEMEMDEREEDDDEDDSDDAAEQEERDFEDGTTLVDEEIDVDEDSDEDAEVAAANRGAALIAQMPPGLFTNMLIHAAGNDEAMAAFYDTFGIPH